MGSNPSAASYYSHPHAVEKSHVDSTFQSLLNQIAQLSPEERNTLLSIAQSGKASTLNSPAEGLADWKSELIARGLAGGTITLYTRTVKRFLDRYPMPSPRNVIPGTTKFSTTP